MRIVDAGYEIINIENPVEKVERIARVCYKSEDKITEGSAEKMVRALIKSNHTAMIEHASLVIELEENCYRGLKYAYDWLEERTVFKGYLRFTKINHYIISGNLRAWREFLLDATENHFVIPYSLKRILLSEKYRVFFEDIEYNNLEDTWNAWEVHPDTLSRTERMTHKDVSVLFTVDRGVSHEIVRHRDASFAQESTRYCNYSGDVTFIRPCFFVEDTPEMDSWVDSCMRAEMDYTWMLGLGRTPQEARAVLPNSLKTELVMTANLREWEHFFKLRALGTTGKPHPQMAEVADPLLDEFTERVF